MSNLAHNSSSNHTEKNNTDYKETFYVFAALIFLTFVTVLTAQINLGKTFNIIVALGIATMKVSLVAYWFMHLKNDTFINKIIFLSGPIFLFLLLLLTTLDVFTR